MIEGEYCGEKLPSAQAYASILARAHGEEWTAKRIGVSPEKLASIVSMETSLSVNSRAAIALQLAFDEHVSRLEKRREVA